jgi:phosphomannomutase
MDLNLSMFRAYDIRTPSASLTPELGDRLSRAEAVYFRDDIGVRAVLVAHDARLGGPRYLQQATEIYREAGLDVVVVPCVCSTSQFYFAAMRHSELCAVMFGASHNPAGDTGRKTLGPGVKPIAEHIGPLGGLDRIKELYERDVQSKSQNPESRISAYDPTSDYLNYSLDLAGVPDGGLAGVRIFHDYLNGAAGREMMLAFGRAGAELTPLHFAADGAFPLGDPNPVKADVIRDGLSRMQSEQVLMGAFFDGDGDRIDIYRGDGAYLSSSFVYAAILPYIRERHAGRDVGVFADLKSNPLAVMEMARAGFKVQVIRNGHSQIKNAMIESSYMIGTVEESAHFYERFPMKGEWYATENTLYVALLVARAWKENPGRMDELFAIQARTSREREWGYKFGSDELRAQALDAVEAHFVRQGAQAMSRMPNGFDLEATMLRKGMPFEIDGSTVASSDWLQVCQRISQSENGLARWEVVAAQPKVAAAARAKITSIVREFGAGEEYQG